MSTAYVASPAYQGAFPGHGQTTTSRRVDSNEIPQTATSSYSPPSPYFVSSMTHDGLRETTESSRCVHSVILNEELLGSAPEESVRYIEVPYVEEIVRHVPRREVIEIEKKVPKIEYEIVERIVEVPQIQYVDRHVEVPQIVEVLKHVSRREVVEVPKEVVRHVPKIETKIVERVVNVPGEIIEVSKPYTVENKVNVPEYHDKEVPMVVSQTVRPVLSESDDYVDVDVIEYEPEVIPVDIHVPKAVQSQILSMGVVEEQHRMVVVPSAQYNSMLRLLNPHLSDGKDGASLPYLQNANGSVSFLSNMDSVPQMQVASGVDIMGYHAAHTHTVHRSGSAAGSHKNHDRSTSHSTDRSVSHRGTRSRGVAVKSYPKTTKKAKGTCPC